MANDASSGELILRFVGDPRNLEQVLTKVRADLSKTGQVQVTTAKESNSKVTSEARSLSRQLEQEERARARAAESLQKQKSAALIAQWKKEAQEKARIEKQKADAEKSSGGGFSNIASQIPVVGNFSTQLSGLTSAGEGAAGGMAAAAGGVAIFVAGAVIGIGVLEQLGEKIFDLTKQSAEFTGKFRDLSQQVGISVETLSTLSNIAENTGGNIDTVTGAMAIFQKHLESSHDPTSEEAKLLKELGVTSTDTETALRQTLKALFAMGETSKQTADAQLLFGKSGRFINAILKESHGDIDEAARKFGSLSTVTTQAAILGDNFNDSYNDLSRTLAGISRGLVSDVIPVFTVFFQQLNTALTGNADDWSFWRDLVTSQVVGVIATVQTAAQIIPIAMQSIGAALLIDPLALFQANVDALVKAAEREKNKAKFEADVERLQRLTQAILAGRPGDTPDADKTRADAAATASKLVQLHQRELEDSTRENTERLNRERDLDIKNIDEWENESITAASDHLFAQLKIYDEELANARKFITGKENLLIAEIEIQRKRSKIVNDTVVEIDKFKLEAQQKRDKTELQLDADLLKIRDAQRAEAMRQVKADLEAGLISQSEAIRRQTEIEKQGVEDRAVHRQAEMDQATTSAERLVALTGEKVQAEIEWTTRFLELTDQRIAALQREAQAFAANDEATQKVFPAQSPEQVQRDAGRAANQAAGEPPRLRATTRALVESVTETGDVFEGLGAVISNTLGLAGQGISEFGNLIADTFGQVAQGVGAAVQAFVLFGSVEGGFKKFAAEVIASVAQMAIVQAVFELAQGLAMIALTWFTGNPKYAKSAGFHFASAAAFGAIGGIAAIAGRAVAGNSFNQQGAGGGGSSGSGGGGGGTSTTSTSKPATVELDRATRAPAATQVNIVITRDPGSIVQAVVQNHRNNGDIRKMIQTEIKR